MEVGTKKLDTVQSMLYAIEPSFLRGLVTIQRQNGSKDNAVRKNTHDIKKTFQRTFP